MAKRTIAKRVRQSNELRPMYAQERFALWWANAYGTLQRIESDLLDAAMSQPAGEADEMRLAAEEIRGALGHLGMACPRLAVESPLPRLETEIPALQPAG